MLVRIARLLESEPDAEHGDLRTLALVACAVATWMIVARRRVLVRTICETVNGT